MDVQGLALVEQLLKVVAAFVTVASLVISALGSFRVGTQSEAIDKLILSSNLSAQAKKDIFRRVRSQRILQIVILVTLAIGAITSIALFAFSAPPDRAFYQGLEQHDPALFSGVKSGAYFIARLLPDRSSLQNDTDYRADITASKNTFDMYVNSAPAIFNTYNKQIEDLVRRGVHVRVLLSDWSEENTNLAAHAAAIGANPISTREDIFSSKGLLDEMMTRFKGDPAVYTGVLEVKYTKELLLYSAWLRDRNTSHAAAHIELQFHSGKTQWPSFRFGKDSGDLIKNLAAEYELLWKHADE